MKPRVFTRLTALLCVLAALLRPLPATGAQAKTLYGDETVTEVYSFDRENRAYHRVTDPADISAAVGSRRGLNPSDRFAADAVGFLIFTDRGRYTFYASPSATGNSPVEQKMIKLSQKMNARYPASAQWLAYMDVGNIERVEFRGFASKRYDADRLGKHPEEFYVVDTADPGEIAQIADCLKRLEVDLGPRATKREDRYVNPVSVDHYYEMTIHFRGGVQYHLFGEYLILSATDQEEQIAYEGKTSEIRGLRERMAGLPSAEQQIFDSYKNRFVQGGDAQ